MSLARKRVLVVEDDKLLALNAVDELKSAGCTVFGPASRLEAAMTLAQAHALDAAVLDVFLGGAYVWGLRRHSRLASGPIYFSDRLQRRGRIPGRFLVRAVPRKAGQTWRFDSRAFGAAQKCRLSGNF